jgi:choice-of-anchor A domain-containing protein
MGVGTVVYANTFSAGYAGWGRSSVIQGDLRVGGTFGTKLQDGAWIHGAVIPDSTLTPMRLTFPAQTVVGGTSRVVESGDSVVLSTTRDYPKDVTVRAGGKLVLRGGRFVFRNLVLNPTAKVYVQTNQDVGAAEANDSMVRIDVHGEFLIDRAIVNGESWANPRVKVQPDARSILWLYSGTQELHINGSTRFLGTLVAPNAKVSLSSTAGFQGSLWAKEVEIHQYNGNLQFLPLVGKSRRADHDQDGLDDTLEFRLGTDPLLTDTDGDGYTDGLEVLGRQNRMGAIKGVTQASPGFAHSWGWALDSTRRDLFNPLRRDQFLRVVWQDSNEILTMQTAKGRRWVDTAGRCLDGQTHFPAPYWSTFAPAWADRAYLDRFIASFADPSDKPLVKNPTRPGFPTTRW